MDAYTERVLDPVQQATLYPDQLRDAEWRHPEREPWLGMALSGGGIRSATLSLGFFQGLARRGLVRSIDYLSTVSGGGYFGGFFGHLLQREAARAKKQGAIPDDLADRILRDPAAPAIRYLRENGRYLSPNGSGDVLAAAAVALRNWVAVIVVLVLLALVLLAGATMIRFASLDGLSRWVALSSLPAPVAALSPYLLAGAIAFLVLAVPPGWAYWLVRDNPQSDGIGVTAAKWFAPVVGFVAAAGILLGTARDSGAGPLGTAEWVIVIAGILATLTMLRFALGLFTGIGQPHRQRRHLTRGLMRALVVIGVLLAIGVVDSIGQWLASLQDLRGPSLMAGVAAAGGLLRKQILQLATRVRANERPAIPTRVLLYAGAVLLIVGLLGIVAAVPHLMVRSGAAGASSLVPPDGWFGPLAVLFAVSMVLVIAVSRVWSFINRSTLHALYEARLRRAYLGASNPARSGEGENRPAVTDPHPGDGMTLEEYDPSRWGGPIHLINVTVNETVSGRSQVQQRDRKGTGMAIGPAGISVGTTDHALWSERPKESALERFQHAASDVAQGLWKGTVGVATGSFRTKRGRRTGSEAANAPFRVFAGVAKPELLDVGQWIAISGGAVSTGLGARTNIALSLLLGFFNVRLGYWWLSGVDPDLRFGQTARSSVHLALIMLRRLLAVQSALLDEWLARFPGVARREWYLTDGGHFENLGGYELLRRRLPFIIVCDNEEDCDYQFDGLANLVRKARTDLDAEITFLSDDDLAAWNGPRLPDCLGSLDALRRGRRSVEPLPERYNGSSRFVVDDAREGLSLKHAALARVEYGAGRPDGLTEAGWLLYVKPSLDGDEPIDVLRYHTEHPDFPHESTGDQFFAEAQWESYRKLGEHLALELFGPGGLEESWIRSLTQGETESVPELVPA
ncbi:MAG TPA: hypothetical protein VLE53_06830 [Gemmatimonadaceae bacterium]|nr:hypothetical protein [Gemmatimonadaceae bacterium]